MNMYEKKRIVKVSMGKWKLSRASSALHVPICGCAHQVEAARSGTYVDVHEYLTAVARTAPALKRGHHGTDAPHVYGWRICGCA